MLTWKYESVKEEKSIQTEHLSMQNDHCGFMICVQEAYSDDVMTRKRCGR